MYQGTAFFNSQIICETNGFQIQIRGKWLPPFKFLKLDYSSVNCLHLYITPNKAPLSLLRLEVLMLIDYLFMVILGCKYKDTNRNLTADIGL